jgi:hypothetical protein
LKNQVTTNVLDLNHHKGTKTLRTPSISKLFLFFVPLWLRVFVVSGRATLVVTKLGSFGFEGVDPAQERGLPGRIRNLPGLSSPEIQLSQKLLTNFV